MAICQPIVSEIAYRTWCIDEYGMDAMFLLEGDEKALLIDTGTGVFDIPELVRQLTNKPVMVALTHGHIDHAGGMNQFEEVYLHPADFAMAQAVTPEERGGYVDTMLSMSDGIYSVTRYDVVVPNTRARLLPLQGGTYLHLGNRDVMVFDTPGHTPGGLSYLDKKERLLFSGDACNMNTLLAAMGQPATERTCVTALKQTAEKLEALHPYYDRHYNGHIGYADAKSCMPMPECLVRDCIALCENLLAGTIVGEKVENPFCGECRLARNNTMQIVYRDDQVK